MPSSWHTTRIENRTGGGVPDVHVCAEGLPFWIELKATKSNRVNVSAHQVAWNFAYSQSGGVSFFLVRTLGADNLYLFDGAHGRGLAEHGLRSGSVGSGSVGSGSVGSGSVGSEVKPPPFPPVGSGSEVSPTSSPPVGPGTVVPCLWSGSGWSGWSGLLGEMLEVVRGRVGVGLVKPRPLERRPGSVTWPGPGV